MKKFTILLTVLLSLVFVGSVYAAVTRTYTLQKETGKFYVEDFYTFTWTGDDVDGSVTAIQTTLEVHGEVCQVVINPGSEAPSANYSITMTDEDDADILGGQAVNLSATVSSRTRPYSTGSFGRSRVDSKLTLDVTQTNVNATGVVKVYMCR